MAKIREIDQAAWREWVAGRPPAVRALCERLPGDRLYRMKSTGQRVTIHSYSEDGTLTVNITGEYNLITFERSVFGVSPDDLVECDLPGHGEPLGAALTEQEDIDEFIAAERSRMGFDKPLKEKH